MLAIMNRKEPTKDMIDYGSPPKRPQIPTFTLLGPLVFFFKRHAGIISIYIYISIYVYTYIFEGHNLTKGGQTKRRPKTMSHQPLQRHLSFCNLLCRVWNTQPLGWLFRYKPSRPNGSIIPMDTN